MSVRRILNIFIPRKQIYQNASLAARWSQTPFTQQKSCTSHSSSAYHTKGSQNAKFNLRSNAHNPDPENTSFNTINRLIPLYEQDSPRTVTVEDWRTESNLYKDARAFRSCLAILGGRKLYDAGKSYIEMVKKHAHHLLTPFNEIHILRFFLQCSPPFQPFANEQDIQYVISTYIKVRQTFPVLEIYSAEVLLLAMQRTPEWRRTLELLDDLVLLSVKPKAIVYSSIIFNAFKENDTDLGWNLIDKMKTFYLCPHDECWIEWLQCCKRSSMKRKDGVDRMLEDFYLHHLKMSIRVANKLTTFIDQLCPEYSLENTSIVNSNCKSCQTELSSEFTSTDHADLKELVEKMINHDSMYASTTPEEMQKFLKFIEHCGPYNLVIDGLNTLYGQKKNLLEDLKMIKYKLKAQILFLGRKHLAWNKCFREIANFSKVFLCENISRDDVFVLKAALHYGTDVKFLSDDKLRAQIHYLVEDNRRNLFLRWRFMNQLEYRSNRFFVPRTYLPETHKTEDGVYHIPCVEESSTDLTWTPAVAKYWLCIRPQSEADIRKKTKSKTSSAARWAQARETLYHRETSSEVSTTLIDELVERLNDNGKVPSFEDSKNPERISANAEADDHVRELMRGFRSKYRRKARDVFKPKAGPCLAGSLDPNMLKDRDVLDNVKRKLKTLNKIRIDKPSDQQDSSTTERKDDFTAK